MTLLDRRTALLAAVFALGAPSAAIAQAGDFPNKPIRVVVTFPPGGSSDAMLRVMAPRIGEKLGPVLKLPPLSCSSCIPANPVTRRRLPASAYPPSWHVRGAG